MCKKGPKKDHFSSLVLKRTKSLIKDLYVSTAFVAGKGPGPSYEAAADLHEVENQGAVSFRGALGCDSRLPASEESSDLQESSEAGTSVSSETSREKVHFKKPGSQRGGRCIRKRSHDPD